MVSTVKMCAYFHYRLMEVKSLVSVRDQEHICQKKRITDETKRAGEKERLCDERNLLIIFMLQHTESSKMVKMVYQGSLVSKAN